MANPCKLSDLLGGAAPICGVRSPIFGPGALHDPKFSMKLPALVASVALALENELSELLKADCNEIPSFGGEELGDSESGDA